jgi:hypothetical protein
MRILFFLNRYSAQTFDFLGLCIDMLCLLADSAAHVSVFGEPEVHLVRQVLRFLSNVCQGPCLKNQEEVAISDVVMTINSIVAASDNSVETAALESDPAYESMLCLSMQVLMACLEGRPDRATHDSLKASLDMRPLYIFARQSDLFVRRIQRNAAQTNRELTTTEEALVFNYLRTTAIIWNLQYDIFPGPVPFFRE